MSYSPKGHKETDVTEQLSTHTYTHGPSEIQLRALALFSRRELTRFPLRWKEKKMGCNLLPPSLWATRLEEKKISVWQHCEDPPPARIPLVPSDWGTSQNLPANAETQVWSLSRKDPWRRKWQPTPVFLSGESHVDRGAWWAIVHGIAKCQTWLTMHTLSEWNPFKPYNHCKLPKPIDNCRFSGKGPCVRTLVNAVTQGGKNPCTKKSV